MQALHRQEKMDLDIEMCDAMDVVQEDIIDDTSPADDILVRPPPRALLSRIQNAPSSKAELAADAASCLATR